MKCLRKSKPLNLLLFVAAGGLFLAFNGCYQDSIPARTNHGNFTVNDTFYLDWHDKDCDTAYSICLTLDSVLSDSRCPLRVMCPWRGNAEVRFLFDDGSTQHRIVLNTFGGLQFPSDTTIGQFTIELIALTPYPVTPDPIDQKDYKAKVFVHK